ncbi:MAG: Amino acid transport protein [Akkermansiaceae bacterium]|nr:Amino acid transport protein [Akkermansiaceae bacterium]
MLDAFNPYTILAGILFSLIGWGAFRYGRQMELWKPKLIGLFLMGYPYFVWNQYAVWIVGVALVVLLWFQHDD